MLKSLLFFILMIFIEYDIFSWTHGLLASQWGNNTAFWVLLGSQVYSISFGYRLIKNSGLKAMEIATSQLQQGLSPSDLLIKKLMMIFGGLLLILPGLLTDLMGYLCLTNFVQKTLGYKLKKLAGRSTFTSFTNFYQTGSSNKQSYHQYHTGPGEARRSPTQQKSEQIIEVEAEDLDKK